MTLEQLPTPFLQCRAYGHAWEEFIPVGMPAPSFGFRVSLLCVRCGSERHDILDTVGRLADRQYELADGYSLGYRVLRADALRVLNAREYRVARRGDLVRRINARA